ncbi:uncharacterized protein LOC114526443 isoform X2 [Dendronephthya gigantea]|uniref:uncharacterized protein LOC114526443 isoform X2 n=1 Tax=Dendronephthya gigantea TaxID=151771 RepID=UPI00106C109B|nr:uncharacterized protein LOC114526443 isoform X2 [Dendronephthya gigantea]
MAVKPFSNDQLNFFKFSQLVLDEFPKALRQTFISMWDSKVGKSPGFILWDDSIIVRNLLLTSEGGKTEIPTTKSIQDWDCTALFKATIFAKTFGVPRKGKSLTLNDLYLKVKPVSGSFHKSVVSLTKNKDETYALAIDQMRLLRNRLCHSSEAEINKADFDHYVLLIKDALTALSVNTAFVDDIETMKEEDFPTEKVQQLYECRMKELQAISMFHENVEKELSTINEQIGKMTIDVQQKLSSFVEKTEQNGNLKKELSSIKEQTDKLENMDQKLSSMEEQTEKMENVEQTLSEILATIKRNLEDKNNVPGSRFGNVGHEVDVKQTNHLNAGDEVISLYGSWAYFTATVVSFDVDNLMYTINWDDGHQSRRVQKYFNVALNKTPGESEIDINTLVLFPQGEYAGTDGSNLGGIRYHQGRVTQIYEDPLGVKKYDGVHTKGASDGKWITYNGYSYEFNGLTRNDLRLTLDISDILLILKTQWMSKNYSNEVSHGRMTKNNGESVYDVFLVHSKLNHKPTLENCKDEASETAEIVPKVAETIFDTDSKSRVAHAVQTKYLKPGDKALIMWGAFSYFPATIVSFDAGTLAYTVNWDDGDPSDRLQNYRNVALSKTPHDNEITVGTLVLFPQGHYHSAAGNNIMGTIYHPGRITRIYRDFEGVKKYDGVHTKGTNDCKWVTYIGYNYEFKGLVTSDLRVFPDAQVVEAEIPAEIEPNIEAISNADTSGIMQQARYLKAGDKALIMWGAFSYYPATIVSFDFNTLAYTVSWDDGDPSDRVQNYLNVSSNTTPNDDEIKVGTLVLFPQGQYTSAAGNGISGTIYHPGRIARVYEEPQGVKKYDGVHTKGIYDGKWLTYRGYSYEFRGLTRNDLRVFPNAGVGKAGTVAEVKPKIKAISGADSGAEIKPGIEAISDTDLTVGVDRTAYLKPGDKAIILWGAFSYYPATIVSFDVNTLAYTVNWDDGDPSDRVQNYRNVALKRAPDDNEILVGTLVLFPQGGYMSAAGNYIVGNIYH